MPKKVDDKPISKRTTREIKPTKTSKDHASSIGEARNRSLNVSEIRPAPKPVGPEGGKRGR